MPVNPVFGHSSLTPHALGAAETSDTDAMDWTPTDVNSGTQYPTKANETGSWLRPQRFFAPEKPTGLESLFERTLLVDDTPRPDPDHNSMVYQIRGYRWHFLILIPVIAMGYKAWDIWRGKVQNNGDFL